MKAVTQLDIGRELGISRSTVKAVFSPDSRVQLREETRRRVFEAAERLRYAPNRAGRRLAQARGGGQHASFDQFGLLYLSSIDPDQDRGSQQIMSGAEHELAKLHASFLFVRVNEPADWGKVEHLMRSGGVDGWLLYGAVDDEAATRLTDVLVVNE